MLGRTDIDRFIPLSWKDIDFEKHKINVDKKMKERTSFEIKKLERTEQIIIEEPVIAFEYLQLELDKQSTALGITKSALKNSDRFILTHNNTAKNTSCLTFNGHLGLFLKIDLAVDYTTSSIITPRLFMHLKLVVTCSLLLRYLSLEKH